jgi:alkyl hydroperoxide reductase subunit F
MRTYDLIIIGAGPAGITAAIYAARQMLDTLILTGDIGGQTIWSGDIENYAGYQFITGLEFTTKLEEHIRKYPVVINEDELMTAITRTAAGLEVVTGKGRYYSKAVIIASGKRSRELGAPGEKEFRNKGVAYCATCDGPLFAGKAVAVIGGGNSAIEAALKLGPIAEKVYIINNTAALGGEAIVREKVLAMKNLAVVNSAEIKEIKGAKFVNSLTYAKQGKEETIPVEGVFVEIGLIPNTGFKSEIKMNQKGEIMVNCRNETNIEGVFAAGDVTDVPEKQIIIAAGEGSKAALSVFKYLAGK